MLVLLVESIIVAALVSSLIVVSGLVAVAAVAVRWICSVVVAVVVQVPGSMIVLSTNFTIILCEGVTFRCSGVGCRRCVNLIAIVVECAGRLEVAANRVMLLLMGRSVVRVVATVLLVMVNRWNVCACLWMNAVVTRRLRALVGPRVDDRCNVHPLLYNYRPGAAYNRIHDIRLGRNGHRNYVDIHLRRRQYRHNRHWRWRCRGRQRPAGPVRQVRS